MKDGRRPVLDDVVAVVMAGGQGERLYPLTRDRGKPAVPFGGIYRVIDFTLSNCLNSGLRRVHVLTQYKSGSLERHVRIGWGPIFHHELDEWIQCVPPQLRRPIDRTGIAGTSRTGPGIAPRHGRFIAGHGCRDRCREEVCLAEKTEQMPLGRKCRRHNRLQ